MIESIRRDLLDYFGPQGWWPADSPDQVAMGAILVQRTTWRQASLALNGLARRGSVRLKDLLTLPEDVLETTIRPAGFYRQKSRYLRSLAQTVMEHGGGLVNWLVSGPLEFRRAELLSVKGVGRETADSILLYAAGRAIFVVDAYTRRILRRHHYPHSDKPYDDLRRLVENEVGRDVGILGEFHAGLVETGKQFCVAGFPRCEQCPLAHLLPPGGPVL